MTSTTTPTAEETIALARKNLHRAPKEVRDAFHVLDGVYQNRPAEYVGTPVKRFRKFAPPPDDAAGVRVQALQTVMEVHALMDDAGIRSCQGENGPVLSLVERVKNVLHLRKELLKAFEDKQKLLEDALRDRDAAMKAHQVVDVDAVATYCDLYSRQRALAERDAAVTAKTKLAEHFDAIHAALNDYDVSPGGTPLERTVRVLEDRKELQASLLDARRQLAAERAERKSRAQDEDEPDATLLRFEHIEDEAATLEARVRELEQRLESITPYRLEPVDAAPVDAKRPADDTRCPGCAAEGCPTGPDCFGGSDGDGFMGGGL